jgi:methylmalonyl-CoA mutase
MLNSSRLPCPVRAAAVYPPGSVVADTAIDLIEKLNQRLGYAQKP